jgi:hypothetical protein
LVELVETNILFFTGFAFDRLRQPNQSGSGRLFYPSSVALSYLFFALVGVGLCLAVINKSLPTDSGYPMGMPLAIVRNDDGVVWDVFLKLPNLKLFSNHWNPDPSGRSNATRRRNQKGFKTGLRIMDEPSRDVMSVSRMPSGHLDSLWSLVINIARKNIDL